MCRQKKKELFGGTQHPFPEQPHAQSIFSISISVWCLTPFFDGKKEGAAMNSINCFRFFDPLSDHI